MAVVFSYLYRDGGNYKRYGEVVFAGALESGLEARLRAALDEGDYFVPAQVDVPSVYLWDDGSGYAVSEDDHCWHEVEGVSEREEGVTDRRERTFAQFVAEVEAAAASGWAVFSPGAV